MCVTASTAVRARLALLASALFLAACGGASSNRGADDPTLREPARLYPMRPGLVWSYDIDTGSGPPTLGITRVVQVEGTRIGISSNGGDPVAYEIRPDGIFLPVHRVYLLKAPIEVGATWPSRSGRTARVSAIDEQVTTPAGTYQRCVRVNETGGEARIDIATVYCPDLGPVLVETDTTTELTGEHVHVRAALRGFVDGAVDAQ